MSTLRVTIYSFSYRRGIPSDDSGNGGGYVFDCRAIHNPGKYPEYRSLTGLDQPVIDFLEADGEITTFLHSVYQLADAHVERYLQRGFTNLMFAFGCTGGQHRSVYSAQHLADHLRERYDIQIHVVHREQARRALILAAGFGTRLKPLTDSMPKALVPIHDKPLLDIVVDRLRDAHYSEIVVNAHHFKEMIIERAKQLGIAVSPEETILNTGGGIKQALTAFTPSLLLGSPGQLLVHNVDILSNADLEALWHEGTHHDVTLLVSERNTTRYLLFNDAMQLVGWTNTQTNELRTPYPDLDPTQCHHLAFAGIHTLKAAALAPLLPPEQHFSIIDFYIQHCNQLNIVGVTQPNLKMLDVGKLSTLQEIRRSGD